MNHSCSRQPSPSSCVVVSSAARWIAHSASSRFIERITQSAPPMTMRRVALRAGRAGEHEQRFIYDNRIYVAWEGLRSDLSQVPSQEALRELLNETYPDCSKKRTINYASQLWPFARWMEFGDWVAVPSKKKAVIHIAEVVGPYEFDPNVEDPYFHAGGSLD